MREKESEQLLAESIRLEKSMAELYQAFEKAFPEDGDFWRELSFEEVNHSILLQSVQETMAAGAKELPTDFVCRSLAKLQESNAVVPEIAGRAARMSREEALNLALQFELSAGEIHFQRFMKKTPDSMLAEIYQQLNQDDKNHAQRIQNYMGERGIPVSGQVGQAEE